MKSFFTSRNLMLLGFVLVCLSNAVLLLGVRSNRAGEPESLVMLTERELGLESRYGMDRENSGLSFRLGWQSPCGSGYYHDTESGCKDWFDEKKLKELGFTDLKDLESRRLIQSKDVFIALEYQGGLFSESLKKAEERWKKEERTFIQSDKGKDAREVLDSARRELEHRKTNSTRLFAMDAALSADILRKKYPDRKKVIITRAVVRPFLETVNKHERVYGSIGSLCVDNIHIPLEHRKLLDRLKESGNSYIRPPRYAVGLAFGKRFEPYIVTVEPL